MLELVLTSLIILVAFGGEALFGFGGGMVAVPLLSLFLDVPEAVVLVVVFQFLLGFRASVIFCLSIANLMRIPLVGYQDLFSFRVIQLASGALPAFGIAVLLGQRYHQRIPEALYFRIVYALLTLTALTLVAKVVL